MENQSEDDMETWDYTRDHEQTFYHHGPRAL